MLTDTDDTHRYRLGTTSLKSEFVPYVMIDTQQADLIRNNYGVKNNNKITNMYIDYTSSPWKLKVEVYIDGTVYTKALNF